MKTRSSRRRGLFGAGQSTIIIIVIIIINYKLRDAGAVVYNIVVRNIASPRPTSMVASRPVSRVTVVTIRESTEPQTKNNYVLYTLPAISRNFQK